MRASARAGSIPSGARPGRAGLGSWAAALAAAAAGGVLVALTPSSVWLVLLFAALAVAITLGPAWFYLAAVVIGGVATALVRIQVPSTVGLLGQGRTAALLAALILLHALIRRVDFRVPKPTLVAAGLYTASVLLAALVAMAGGREAGAVFSDLQRELSQTLAPLLIGLVALSSRQARPRAFRVMGVASLGVSLMVLAYWAWSSSVLVSVPAGVESLFENARDAVDERGLAPERIVFPFVDTDPNSSAAILAMLAALTVAPLTASRGAGDRVLAALILVASIAAVLSTQSRMGILLLVAIGIGYTVLAPFSGRVRARVALGALAASAVVVTIALATFPEDRLVRADDRNVRSRLAVYQEALDDVSASPLYGHGLRYAAAPRYHTGLSVHNEYLQRFVDGGLVGGLAFLAALGTFTVMALLTRNDSPFETGVRTGALTTLAVLMISMAAVASWTAVPFLQILSWLLFGVISSTYVPPPDPRDVQSAM